MGCTVVAESCGLQWSDVLIVVPLAVKLPRNDMASSSSLSQPCLCSVTARLDTYESCPKELIEWPRRGFVYNDSDGSVQCADCKKSVTDWRATFSTDKILRYHEKGCRFLKPEANDRPNSDDGELEEEVDGVRSVAEQRSVYGQTVDLRRRSLEPAQRDPSRKYLEISCRGID